MQIQCADFSRLLIDTTKIVWLPHVTLGISPFSNSDSVELAFQRTGPDVPNLSNKWLLWWQERKFWKTDDVAWVTSLEMLFFFEYIETNRNIFNRCNIWFLGQNLFTIKNPYTIKYFRYLPPPCIPFLLFFCLFSSPCQPQKMQLYFHANG